jgi:8-oxo-dGTP diphosphatase
MERESGGILTTRTAGRNRGYSPGVARLRTKAMVWVVRPGGDGRAEVLLLQRSDQRGGGFHPVTGKAEPGESALDAAAREAQEETGLAGPLADLRFQHEFARAGRRFVEHAFLLSASPGAQVTLSGEHVAADWVAPAEAVPRLRWTAHKASLVLALAAWELRPEAAAPTTVEGA